MKVLTAEISGRINASISRKELTSNDEQINKRTFAESVRVTLSEMGRSKSAEAEAEKKIDDSNLPDDVKEILRMIRRLKLEIARVEAELNWAMGDQAQTTEERQLTVESIQVELNALQAALAGANSALLTAIRQHRLSDEQVSEAMGLSQV